MRGDSGSTASPASVLWLVTAIQAASRGGQRLGWRAEAKDDRTSVRILLFLTHPKSVLVQPARYVSASKNF